MIDAPLHVLYAGVSQSGKTTLARHHARLLDRAGHELAVYDPVGTATAGGDWPERAQRFDSPHALLAWLEKHRADPEHPVYVFVDESADVFGHSQRDAHWVPRRIRHQWIYLRLLSQRPKMLPPDVRSQCGHAYVFRLASEDMRMVLSDFGHDLKDVPGETLDTGDFLLLVSGSSTIDSDNVFDLVD